MHAQSARLTSGNAQVDAAWLAASKGVTTVIASGKGGDSVLKVVAGQLVGTMFSREASASLLEAHQNASRCSPSLSAAGIQTGSLAAQHHLGMKRQHVQP